MTDFRANPSCLCNILTFTVVVVRKQALDTVCKCYEYKQYIDYIQSARLFTGHTFTTLISNSQNNKCKFICIICQFLDQKQRDIGKWWPIFYRKIAIVLMSIFIISKQTRFIVTVMYDFCLGGCWSGHTCKHNCGPEPGCGQQPIFFCGIISNKWMQ